MGRGGDHDDEIVWILLGDMFRRLLIIIIKEYVEFTNAESGQDPSKVFSRRLI